MKLILKFIKKNTKELISLNYFLSLVVMLSLAWLFNTPALNHSGYNQSNIIVRPYDIILIYFITINMLLHIGNHFRDEIKSGRINLLRNKFSDAKTLGLYISSYFVFFFTLNIVPVYSTALFQQWINAPHSINVEVFLIDSFSQLFGYGFIGILLTIYLVFNWISETRMVLLLYAFIILMSFSNILLHFNLFNMDWMFEIYSEGIGYHLSLSIMIWLFLICAVIMLLIRTVKDISPKLIQKPYYKGLFTKLFDIMKLNMSKHHLCMMGLETQKILILFSTAGAVVLYSLLKIKGADFLVLSKIYLGAIIPITFSFNQQQIVDVDKDAGMLNIILIRNISYYMIILNRWLLLIFPQILIVTIYFTAFFLNTDLFNTSFYLYLVALNITGSLLNLNLHILTGKSGIAKIFVLLFFYIPLRSDVQIIFNSNFLLNKLNIFSPLSNFKNVLPTIYQQSTLTLFIIILLTLSPTIMKRIKCNVHLI